MTSDNDLKPDNQLSWADLPLPSEGAGRGLGLKSRKSPKTPEPDVTEDIEPLDRPEPAPDEEDPEVYDIPEKEVGDPWGGNDPAFVRDVVEAGILASGKPMSIFRLQTLFEDDRRPHRSSVRQVLGELREQTAGRAMELKEVATGYRFQTRSDLAPHVSRLWAERPQRYSRATLETLAIILYKGPVTRGDIEDLRGVSLSSTIIHTLQERGWIRIVGRRDTIGRPAEYAHTEKLLADLNMKTAGELPPLADVKDLNEGYHERMHQAEAVHKLSHPNEANQQDSVMTDFRFTGMPEIEGEDDIGSGTDLAEMDELNAKIEKVLSSPFKPDSEEDESE